MIVNVMMTNNIQNDTEKDQDTDNENGYGNDNGSDNANKKSWSFVVGPQCHIKSVNHNSN